MSPSESAQRTILTVMIISAAIVVAGRMMVAPAHPLKKEGSVVRIGIGTVSGSILLMTLAKAQPQMAKLMAYLVLLGTTYTYGPVVLKKFTKTVSGDITVVTEAEWKKSKLPKKGK